MVDAALFQKFHPEEYYKRVLKDSGARPDGRTPTERRAAQLSRGSVDSAHGSASVCFGQSSAVAGVRAEVTEALPEEPPLGRVSVSVQLSPLSSTIFRERHRAQAASTFLSNALTDVLNSARVFDPAQLSIREGELYWVLHTHVVCLNFDGNAFDLCLLAALAALEDTRLPSLVEDPSVPQAFGVQRRLVEAAPGCTAADVLFEGRRVKLNSRPLPATFAQLPGEHWVLDPCAAEEGLGATVSLCLVGGRWVVHMQGGSADADRFLGQLMPAARASAETLQQLLDTSPDG